MKESTMITISLRGLPIGWSCPVRQYRSTSKGAGWNVSGQLRGAGVAFPLMNPDDWPNILEHFGFSKLRLSDVFFFLWYSKGWPQNSAGNWTRSSFSCSGLNVEPEPGFWNQPGGWIDTIIKAVRLDDGKVVAYASRQHFCTLEAGGFHQGS